MDPRVARLTTVEQCHVFAENATEKGVPHLADQARKRAIQIRAKAFGAVSDVERACLEAVFAYEEVLSVQKGTRVRAGRTWPMLNKKGILPGVEHIVSKRSESVGYSVLVDMGMAEFAFEAVILRFPSSFSSEVVDRARARLQDSDGSRSSSPV